MRFKSSWIFQHFIAAPDWRSGPARKASIVISPNADTPTRRPPDTSLPDSKGSEKGAAIADYAI